MIATKRLDERRRTRGETVENLAVYAEPKRVPTLQDSGLSVRSVEIGASCAKQAREKKGKLRLRLGGKETKRKKATALWARGTRQARAGCGPQREGIKKLHQRRFRTGMAQNVSPGI